MRFVARRTFLLSVGATVLKGQSAGSPHVIKAAGVGHKLVLMSDGTVAGWGEFAGGQLGPVAKVPQLKGRRFSQGLAVIELPAKAVDIAASIGASYAMLENGSVAAWGGGANGELGIGPEGRKGSETPVVIPGLANVEQIVAMGRTALALLKDGTVRAWGSREMGMVGDGFGDKRYQEDGRSALSPVVVPGAVNVKRLAVGTSHVLALKADGGLLSWGSNLCGELGRAPRRETPMDEVGEIPGLTGVLAVAGGLGVSTVVKKDGTVWVWGANWNGQFGNGERTDPPGMNNGWELVPQRVPGVSNVVGIALGTGRHTLALLKDGTLRGWGNTDWGQIGAGVAATFQEKPVIPRISGVKAVFACGNNSFAVRNDNSFWMWGAGDRRAWPLTANTSVPTQIALK